jgi:hypothetical protein
MSLGGTAEANRARRGGHERATRSPSGEYRASRHAPGRGSLPLMNAYARLGKMRGPRNASRRLSMGADRTPSIT